MCNKSVSFFELNYRKKIYFWRHVALNSSLVLPVFRSGVQDTHGSLGGWSMGENKRKSVNPFKTMVLNGAQVSPMQTLTHPDQLRSPTRWPVTFARWRKPPHCRLCLGQSIQIRRHKKGPWPVFTAPPASPSQLLISRERLLPPTSLMTHIASLQNTKNTIISLS